MRPGAAHRIAQIALVAALAACAMLMRPPFIAHGAPASPSAEAGVLGLGAHGPTVRALQRELRSRGLRVAVDGVYGPATRRAVARFQRRLGLRVNGLVDRPLLWWLGLSVCDLPGPTSARGGVDGVLRLGAYGPKVCDLQRLLVRAGATLAVDGGFGPATRAAVRAAQRRLGMRPNGVATAALRARLRRAPRAPRALLSLGSEGPQVRRLQEGLRRAGLAVAVDGAFGPATRRAVAAYQRGRGLRPTGTAGTTLLRRLRATRARHLLVFPVRGPHAYSDDFGAPRHQGPHEGNDILAPPGAPVLAVAGGRIDRLTRVPRGLGGIHLWLDDDAGTAYYYAHLRRIAPGLVPGSRVRAGQVIGDVGRTGDAAGGPYHLHFEMHPGGGAAVDPYRELRDVDPAVGS
jgi:peptidoglycan hydrolase-like protein with peptidoglycan-binding domain